MEFCITETKGGDLAIGILKDIYEQIKREGDEKKDEEEVLELDGG